MQKSEIAGEGGGRTFDTGAIRDVDTSKVNVMGHISPLVTKRYCQFLHDCRRLKDGTIRDAQNWKLGMTKTAWLESLVRHVEDVKLIADGYPDEATTPDMEKALCAVLFNTQGLLYELLREKRKPTVAVVSQL